MMILKSYICQHNAIVTASPSKLGSVWLCLDLRFPQVVTSPEASVIRHASDQSAILV